MINWPIESLHDKITIKHGFPFKSEFFSDQETNYIVLTPGNFLEEGGFKRQAGKEKYYTGDIPEGYLHCKDDLIVAMTEQAAGLLGSCARVPESGVYLHNQRLGLIRANPEKASLEFIYHLFKTKTVREQIRASSSGSKVKHTSPQRIYDVKVPFPSLDEQKKIAKFLDAIEQKIELNNKMNAELEAMAKLIYDYWFVQFDFPDSDGKPYISSGGKMVYNEELKREIPEGWTVDSLGDLGEFKNGVNYDKSSLGGTLCPIINVRNISASSFFIQNKDLDVVSLSQNNADTYSIDSEDILIARSGIPGATRLVSGLDKNTIFCGFAIRYQLQDSTLKLKVFFFLKDLEKSIQSGSGGTILKNVNQATLKDLLFALPNKEDLVNSFNEIISPIFDRINLVQKENNQLTELRDWLLPMLMNGQLVVQK